MKKVGVLQAVPSVDEVAVDIAPSLTAAAPERHMVEVFLSAIAAEAVTLRLIVLLVVEVSVAQGSILAMVSEVIAV